MTEISRAAQVANLASEIVSVKDFGAVGDGVTDDTAAIQSALNLQRPIILENGKTYKTSATLTAYNSVVGKATISLVTDSVNGIEITGRSEFEFSGFTITSSNTTSLYTDTAQGIEINNCSNFKVEGLGITYFTDGISVSTSDAFVIQGNKIHEIGQELIAVRYCSGWSVVDNYGYNHNGDGILIKGNALHGGLISGNTVKDGVDIYGYVVKGGGITCNLENGDTTAIVGLSITDNIISAVSYGIVLVGALNFTVTGNKILNLTNGKGIYLDEAVVYNPNSVQSGYGVISNNVIINLFDDEGIRVRLDGTVNNLPCVISDNFVDIVNSTTSSINAQGCIVSNNIIKGGLVNLVAVDCVVSGNTFSNTSTQTDAGIKLFGKTSFTGNVALNWNNYVQVRADFDGTILGNTITTASTQRVLTITAGAEGTVSGNNLTNSGAGGLITQFDGKLSVDQFTSAQLVRQTRSAAPTAGTWQVGDIIYNVNASAGGNIGWVCVTAGTPGTWKSFGSIAA